LKLAELQKFVQQRGGRMPDRYARDGLVMARVLLAGSALEEMLTIPSIATVDLPPRATLLLAEIDNTMLDNLPNVKSPEPDAPRICVVDSGLTTGHPLLSTAVGEAMVASSSLTSPLDDNGHGTFVAGIAVYGNIEQCRQNLDFTPKFWIDSARVTNAHGEFDNERLIPTQMREAITYFADLGCRIFNISLGDRKSPYLGGKPSAWADVLDNLAHERDILIVVSAGNYEHDALDDVEPIAVLSGASGKFACLAFAVNAQAPPRKTSPVSSGILPDAPLRDYPRYLLSDPARIIEPATAANVLTVGALAIGGLPRSSQGGPFRNDVSPRTIAYLGQPAPFTRTGPGVRGAIKPELVEYGGSWSYNGAQGRVVRDTGLGILSLNASFAGGQLFKVDHGTSFAAPRVAHLAAQLMQSFPDISANLVRALLVHSASIPAVADDMALTREERMRFYGYGLVY